MKNLNSNQLKIAAILTYITMGISFIISIIYTPIMINILGKSEYGLYNLSTSIIAYLSILNFGFGSTYIRYYSKYKSNSDLSSINKLNGMFFFIFLIIGLIVVILGLGLSFYSDKVLGNQLTLLELNKAKILLIILTINLAVTFPNIVFISYIISNERFIFIRVISLIKTMVTPIAIIIILSFGYGSIGMAIVITIINTCFEFFHFLYAKKRLKIQFDFKSFDITMFKEMIIFSSFIFINLITDQINWNVDKLIIGRYRGTNSVAVYSVASIFNTYYLQLSIAVSSVFIPRIHNIINLGNKNNEMTQLISRVGRVQFIILMLFLSGFIFFGRQFLYFWVGVDFIGSYFIIIILIVSVTIPVIQSLGIEAQRAMNLHKFRSTVYLLIAFVNIVASIPLVILFDGIGAALGTAFALIIGNGIIMNIYYHKKIGFNVIYFWKEIASIIPGLLIPFIFGFFLMINLTTYNLTMFILLVGGYGILYIFSMWLFGLNKYEKELLCKFSLYIKALCNYR